jgi:hypothetical protein
MKITSRPAIMSFRAQRGFPMMQLQIKTIIGFVGAERLGITICHSEPCRGEGFSSTKRLLRRTDMLLAMTY